MKKFLAKSAHYFWICFAVLLVLAAVLVQLARELSPLLNNNKDAIAEQLAGMLHSQVRLGHLEAEWEGLSPSIRILDLGLYPADADLELNQASLSVGRASLRLNLMRSVFQARLVIESVTLSDTHARLQQDKNGDWHLFGIANTAQGGGSAIDDPMDIFLLADQVQADDISLVLENYFGNRVNFAITTAQFENGNLFHRLRANLTLEGEPIANLVVEAKGDPRSKGERDMRAYLSLRDLPVKRIQDLLISSGWNIRGDELQSSRLNLQAWLEHDRLGHYQLTGEVALGLVETNLKDSIALPSRVTGQFHGDVNFAQPGLALSMQVNDLAIAWPELQLSPMNLQLDYGSAGWQVLVNRLDLHEFTEAVAASGYENHLLNSALESLNAQGTMNNILFQLPADAPADFNLQANLADVNVDEWRGTPALSGVTGFLSTGAMDGYVKLESEQPFSAFFKEAYDHSLNFDSVAGAVRWQLRPEQNAIYVNSGLLRLTEGDSDARAQFRLYVPWKKGTAPMDMTLAVGLTNGNAEDRFTYVPKVLSEELRDWLATSILSGQSSEGGFLFRGRFGGESVESVTQLKLAVTEGAVRYHPDWPEVSDVTGTVVVNNGEARVAVERGHFWNTQVSATQLSVQSHNHELVLKLDGRAEGPGEDGLRLLRETPLHEVLGTAFDDWQLTSKFRGSIALTVPLSGESQQQGYQHVQVQLKPGSLTMAGLGLTFSSLSGAISYDSRDGLSSRGLAAKLWDEPVQVAIKSFPVNAEPAKEGATGHHDIEVGFQGQVAVAGLQSWLARPELSFLSGKTAVTGALTIPDRSRNPDLPNATLALQADLVGVDINLPGEWAKAAEVPAALAVSVPIYGDAYQVDLNLDSAITAQINLQESGVTSVAVGLHTAPQVIDRQVNIAGTTQQADVEAWLEVIDRYQAYAELLSGEDSVSGEGDQMPVTLSVNIEQAEWHGITADELLLQAEQKRDHWLLNLDSGTVTGQLQIPVAEEEPLIVNLSSLHLPAFDEPEAEESTETSGVAEQPATAEVADTGGVAEANADPAESDDLLADVDFSQLPAMDVTLDGLYFGNEDYGNWRFRLRHQGDGIVLDQIEGFVRGVSVTGTGEKGAEPGAKLLWQRTDTGDSSHFSGRLVASDLREVLYLWQKPELLETSKAVFTSQLSWSGSPAAIDYMHLQGDIDVDIAHGRFIQGVEGGGDALLRLVALFNFDSWARRLRLGMSDLVDSGLSFDSIDGTLQFNNTELLLSDPLVVKAPSSTLRYAGVIDLANEQLDTKLVATLPVGGNLTLIAALAGGLPAAAGVWAASKLFKDQVNRVASVSYSITGSWAEPDVEFVRLFDNNTKQANKKKGEGEQPEPGTTVEEAPAESLPVEVPGPLPSGPEPPAIQPEPEAAVSAAQ
ncbi:YhdP family protein [Halioxenophilus sp. WMMB6]|uniref:YhdP family protein n=1 Tax=Halioxenophilus sp. WMMB6 TaxID=3073815 RepID=UPI00295ED90F|nr:YhdP family protein [Halioxenophilus sp. WMMB6]